MISESVTEKHIRDDYIFALTDDTGMFQHAKYGIPDPRHGYTTDDNVRALIMALMLYEKYRESKYMDLVRTYASFFLNAQNEKGTFANFMDYQRNWMEEEGSEDCFGRCLWSLGYAISNPFTPEQIKKGLLHIWKHAVKNVSDLHFLRAKAYSVIGLSMAGMPQEEKVLRQLADDLCAQYARNKKPQWEWFEDTVTYCNNIFPWALLSAYRVTGEKRYLQVGEESLQFLESVSFSSGYFKPVGCKGWFSRGGKAAEFDEQPVEACEAIMMYKEAYQVTGKISYKMKAQICYKWYEGLNSNGISLIDNEWGGCCDGITEEGINYNMGAESLVSYIMSYLAVSDMETEDVTDSVSI